MSGAFPTTPKPMDVNLMLAAPVLFGKMASGRRKVRRLALPYWKLTAKFNNMTRADFAPIMAFIAAQEGRGETFTFTSPLHDSPQGDPVTGSAPLVNGASQTGKSLITDAWANSTLIFKAGDIFKLNGNSKVYMITADQTSDGSGNKTLAFVPALIASPANNEALTVTSVPFTVFLANDVQEFPADLNEFFTFELDMEEFLP